MSALRRRPLPPVLPRGEGMATRSLCNFSLKLANRRHVFLALRARKKRDALNKRKTNFALTCNIRKVIRALAFRSREKLDNSFLFKIVDIV